MSRYLSQLMDQTGLKIAGPASTPGATSQPTPATVVAPAAPLISAPSLTEQEVQSETESLTPELSEDRPVTTARPRPSFDPTAEGAPPPPHSQESKPLSLIEKKTHASPIDPTPASEATIERVRAWVALASNAPERPTPARISTPSDATQFATATIPPEAAGTPERPDVEGKSAPKVRSSSSRVCLPGIAARPRSAGSASPAAELEDNLWSVNIGAIHLAIEAPREQTSLRAVESRPAPSTFPPRTNSSRLWRYYLRPF